MTTSGGDIIALITGGAIEQSLEDTISGGDITAIITAGVLEVLLLAESISDPCIDTVLDKKILPIVLKTINKYGKCLTYTVNSTSEHDVSTGNVIIATNDVLRLSIPPFKPELKYIDGDLIRTDDFFSGIAAQGLPFTPIRGMIVAIDGVKYRILNLKPIYSGNQIAMYEFQLRK